MTGNGSEQLNDFENDDVEVGAEITVEDDPDGDEEAMNVMKSPKDPSQQELEDHRTSHIPYRSWCRWCVLGRGRGLKHTTGQNSDIPIIGVDYFFITSGEMKKRTELEYTDEALEKA